MKMKALKHLTNRFSYAWNGSKKLNVTREDMEFGKRLPTVNNYITNVLTKFFNVRIITSGGRYGGQFE